MRSTWGRAGGWERRCPAEEILRETGKDIFRGAYALDGYEYKKAAPKVRALVDPKREKLVPP